MENHESPDSAMSSSYDLFTKLHKASYDNYDHRQIYEWKMCIIIMDAFNCFHRDIMNLPPCSRSEMHQLVIFDFYIGM